MVHQVSHIAASARGSLAARHQNELRIQLAVTVRRSASSLGCRSSTSTNDGSVFNTGPIVAIDSGE